MGVRVALPALRDFLNSVAVVHWNTKMFTTKLSHILETEFTVFYFWKSFDSASLSVTGLNPTISGMYYFHPFAQYFPLFIFPSIKLNL